MKAATGRLLPFFLGFVLLVRLLSLGTYPLTDSTEARYAEIARKMLETGQWLVPQIDYGTPFWGKPPLSFWLTALSYKFFGVSEFSARLPAFLLVLAGMVLVAKLGSEYAGRRALTIMTLGMTTALVFLSAGVVETDPALFFGTTLAMVSFWRALHGAPRIWGYLFFVGLAIGLLAKGPVAVVIVALATGAWTIWSRQWRAVWICLPWIQGTLLAAVLTLPWYLAAEHQNPGFLRYFLIGEHWQRFTVSGWKGDLYGSGHPYPFGTIWLFLLGAALPWIPLCLWRLAREPVLSKRLAGDPLNVYLLSWLLAPAVFFTLARNILPAYVLPGLAAFPLLVAVVMEAWPERPMRWALALGAVMPITMMLVLTLGRVPVDEHSQRDVVAQYVQDRSHRLPPLIYYGKRPSSAVFYSGGLAMNATTVDDLERKLQPPGPEYVVLPSAMLSQLPPALRQALEPAGHPPPGPFILLRERSDDVQVEP